MALNYAPADHTRHLVTKGNLGFVANNTDLYKLVKDGNKFRKYYNVAPGQLVIWKESTVAGTLPKTIGVANLTVNDLPDIKIGVGFSSKKNGISDQIRALTPTELEGCRIDLLDAVGPQCAVPQIKALYPDCVSCDTITARVRVLDNASASFSDEPLKAYQEFTGSYTPDCSSCTDCPQTVTCDEVVCGLVDALNNDTDLTINDGSADGIPYPHYYNTGVKRPFTAFKLWPTWKSYCISPNVGTGCTKCNSIDDLTTFTVNGVATNFNLKDPANNTATLIAQLETAVILINEKFESVLGRHGGRAFLSRGNGNCCPLQLFVTTCDEDFAIAGLVECGDAIDQFPDFVTSGTCKQCGTTDTTTTPTCGLGIFVAPDYESCEDCLGFNQAQLFTARRVDVDIISGSGNYNTPRWSKRAELLEPQVAQGFGSQIQALEYYQQDAVGFEGFQYEIGNETSGWLNLPERRSRIKNALTASCDTSYCSYLIRTRGTTEYGIAKQPMNLLIQGHIHVPENDSTTKTAVEALFQKLIDLIPTTCKVLHATKCDQTELDPA